MTGEDVPGWHRLAREARHRADGFALTAGSAAVIAAISAAELAGILREPAPAVAPLPVRLAVAAVTCALAVIQSRRWRERARWLTVTPQWWECQDEMPSVLPFPRAAARLSRKIGSNYG